mgnify:CR=1 FL=1
MKRLLALIMTTLMMVSLLAGCGGGNTATAGAQISGKTIKEVLDDLVASIDKFYEE